MSVVQFDWAKMKNIQKIHRLLYAIGLGPLIGRIILLLTTTGRKVWSEARDSFQYEKIGDDYYVGAARGRKQIGCGTSNPARRWKCAWARGHFKERLK
jgi:hypothetical protein